MPLFIDIKKKQIPWDAMNLRAQSQPTPSGIKTTTPQTTQYGTGQLFVDASEGVENTFGAPAYLASGGNPLTGKPLVPGGGSIPRGFSNQVSSAFTTSGIPGGKHIGPIAGFAAGIMEPLPSGKAKNAAKVAKSIPKVFTGFRDLTTRVLEDLKGRSTVAKQYILDATNRPELKQVERDMLRRHLADEGDTINVKKFAKKIHDEELLPLSIASMHDSDVYTRYENISLPSELRGPVAKYDERIYNSPIQTSAGNTHFSGFDSSMTGGYFAHTRIEDLPLPENTGLNTRHMYNETGDFVPGDTRRVIELQSDLFQKGRLEGEVDKIIPAEYGDMSKGWSANNRAFKAERLAEVAKLEPYRNTWHERVIREEVKRAAIDGKTKLQFPTGETAMKIEGLGDTPGRWNLQRPDTPIGTGPGLNEGNLNVGAEIFGDHGRFIITDVLGDGKFKAVQKNAVEDAGGFNEYMKAAKEGGIADPQNLAETFDISGKVDTNNPIYKFYEKEVGKFLTNKFGAKVITDPQGVKWYELNVVKEEGKKPVQAFGKTNVATLLGGTGIAGTTFGAQQMTKGKELTYNKQDSSLLPTKTKKIMESIAYNESRGVDKPYEYRQFSGTKSLGDALGKYQITEGELKTYGKRFLGFIPTTKVFLNTSMMQDQYMKNKIEYYSNMGYTPQQIADIHRSGFKKSGEPGTTEYQSPGYVESFDSQYGV